MHALSSNTTLQHLLDANRRFELVGRGTSNHCPMALTALAAMGADALRLERFFQFWEKRYAITAQEQPVLARSSWQAAIGQAGLFYAARDCFAAWVGQEGAAAVLREIVGQVGLAPASGAFHAMIRLAYGLEARNANEIGAGLAALVCGQLVIEPAPPGRAAAASVQDGLAQLSGALLGVTVPGTWIATRLLTVAQLPAFQSALPALPLDVDLFSALRLAALQLYWQSEDFVALHMVTGMHAARVVLSQLPQDTVHASLSGLWAAFCAAHVVVGASPLQGPHLDPVTEDWPALFTLAIASNDDHDIKLVHTCFEENRVSPSPLYFAAALRRMARQQGRQAARQARVA